MLAAAVLEGILLGLLLSGLSLFCGKEHVPSSSSELDWSGWAAARLFSHLTSSSSGCISTKHLHGQSVGVHS